MHYKHVCFIEENMYTPFHWFVYRKVIYYDLTVGDTVALHGPVYHAVGLVIKLILRY